ncbi:MAG: hypothetical protein ACI3V4_04215 [Faecousia sp.]
MLKCHLDSKTNTCKIDVEGNAASILADLSYLINDIYLAFRNHGPIMGEAFKFSLQKMVGDDSSPIWQDFGTQEGEQEVREDGVKGVSVLVPSGLRDLLDDLRGNEHGE